MPRACDYLVEGYTYHLTHRCQEQLFLLNAARERDAYREWLREGVKRYGVPVYGYSITCNHVHVIVHASDREAVSRLMQLASGATAKGFNTRKDRKNAMWEHPYHCTVIQNGKHLLNCLCYVDLNMVRTEKIKHPGAWRWCGYHELTGSRKRYRILDIEHLVAKTSRGSVSEFQQWYRDKIEEKLSKGRLKREAHWTDSLAVGDHDFVEQITKEYRNRYRFAVQETAQGVWSVREGSVPYNEKANE